MPSLFSLGKLHLLLVAAVLFLAGTAGAADLTAKAVFSREVTGVGEPVQFLVQVTGGRSVGQPPEIAVDGLKFNYLGPSQSTRMQFQNGRLLNETSVTYIYQVEATRTGNFTVPSMQFSLDGKSVKTQPVALRVEKGSDDGTATGLDAMLGKMELIIPKKSVFVGESVPVEIRLSGDSRIRWQPEAMPEIPGEGFTKQKMPEPKEEHGRQNGRDTDVYVFRTVITPSKAGKLTLGPIEIPYIAQVPRAQRNNRQSGSLFDLFDNDVFGDPMYAVNQRYKARVNATELEVKPLPAVGRPADFSGAVGQFKFEGTGSPNRVKIGDPVTMNLTVTGRGNFDRIEAPALADLQGWRSYPATADFKASDDLGATGTKTFSVAVIPETKKTAMPVFSFSYFDPETAKYVTLKSTPAPLEVTGVVPPTPSPAALAVAEDKAPQPAAPAAPADILGLRYDAGGGSRSFTPIYLHREFLLAQSVPFVALLGFLFVRLHRTDLSAKAVAALRREKTETQARLRGRELSDQEFLETAARVVRLDTAIATGRSPGSVDAAFACASRPLDAETAEGVEKIFSARAEVLYAGAGGGEQVSAEERRGILQTLEKFERSHARS